MELIRNKFPVILYRVHKKYTTESGSMKDLMDCLWKAVQFNSESSYNYNELFTGLHKNPIQFQFSIAVCAPHIFTKASSQKQFFVDHFTLDLLVNSFSKTEFLTDTELRDSVLALRSVLKITDSNDAHTTEACLEIGDCKRVEATSFDPVTLRFNDGKTLEFDKDLLSSASDVLKVMLDKDSNFSERGLTEITLKGDISSETFKTACHLVCCCRQLKDQSPSSHDSDDPSVHQPDPFDVLSVLDMYNFVTTDIDPEKLAEVFIINCLSEESTFAELVSKSALLSNISMCSLNLLSVIVFQHLFSRKSTASENDCVSFMKHLSQIPQFASLLLECFQEKVVKFYFSN